MEAASLEGAEAPPKGLRYWVGVAVVTAGDPPNLVQKWLGNPSARIPLATASGTLAGFTQLSTTAIYANAAGAKRKMSPRRCGG